jgi:hypothetical protein
MYVCMYVYVYTDIYIYLYVYICIYACRVCHMRVDVCMPSSIAYVRTLNHMLLKGQQVNACVFMCV